MDPFLCYMIYKYIIFKNSLLYLQTSVTLFYPKFDAKKKNTFKFTQPKF